MRIGNGIRSLGIGFAAFLLAAPTSTNAGTTPPDPIYANHCADMPAGEEPLVKNAEDALHIGYVMNRIMVPNLSDEKTWTAGITAHLRSQTCVWEISERPTKNSPISGVTMGIGQYDGRFLGILISQ